MSIAVDVAIEAGCTAISRSLAVEAVRATLRSQRTGRAKLSIAFVSDRTIARINVRHLGRRGTTDVIAFAFAPIVRGDAVTGDIYIAPDVARRSAREHKISAREELVRLVVHGTLHVLGFDHPDGESRTRSDMWKRQERIVQRVVRARQT